MLDMLKYFILPVLENETSDSVWYIVVSVFHKDTTYRNSYVVENLKLYQVWSNVRVIPCP